MSVSTLLVYALVTTIVIGVGAGALHVLWLAVGAYRIRQAGPRPITATGHVVWRDPGEVERLDLIDGPGGRDGAPVPPFTFIEEHLTGSQPCVSVRDARSRRWLQRAAATVEAPEGND